MTYYTLDKNYVDIDELIRDRGARHQVEQRKPPFVGTDARLRVSQYLSKRKHITAMYDGAKRQAKLRESTDKLLQDLAKMFAEKA